MSSDDLHVLLRLSEVVVFRLERLMPLSVDDELCEIQCSLVLLDEIGHDHGFEAIANHAIGEQIVEDCRDEAMNEADDIAHVSERDSIPLLALTNKGA